MTTPSLLTWLVLGLGVPLSAFVALRLRRLSRDDPANGVLKYQLLGALVVLLIAIVFGLIFLNNDMTTHPLSLDATKIITRVAILGLIVIPDGYWLWLNRDGGAA